MILGVPTFAVIYYIVKMLVNHQLENHTLPTDTAVQNDQCRDYVIPRIMKGEYARGADEAVKRENTNNEEEKGE